MFSARPHIRDSLPTRHCRIPYWSLICTIFLGLTGSELLCKQSIYSCMLMSLLQSTFHYPWILYGWSRITYTKQRQHVFACSDGRVCPTHTFDKAAVVNNFCAVKSNLIVVTEPHFYSNSCAKITTSADYHRYEPIRDCIFDVEFLKWLCYISYRLCSCTLSPVGTQWWRYFIRQVWELTGIRVLNQVNLWF